MRGCADQVAAQIILVNDPRFWTWHPAVITLTLLSIVPFCGCLG